MIEFTDRAISKIRDLLNDQEEGKRCLRLVVASGGCSGWEYGMTFEAPRPGDVRVEGIAVDCVVDEGSVERLRGSTVDFDDGLHGKGFEIRNPNATETCGCGRSFA